MIRVFAVYFLCLFSFLSCNTSRPLPPTIQTITIGWIGPLSGPASLLGIDNLKAVQLALSEYQESKKPEEPNLLILSADDQYQDIKSREFYHQFVAQGAQIIFLTTYSSLFDLSNDILRDEVIAIDPIDNDANLARLNQNLFFIAKATEDLAKILIDALAEHKKKKAFVLFFSGDDFMPYLAEYFKNHFPEKGGQVELADYDFGTENFSSFISKSLSFKPDAYVLLGYQELGNFMQQARAKRIKTPFYTPNIAMESLAKQELEGTYFVNFTHLDGQADRATQFLERYQTKYGAPPNAEWAALQAYDAAGIVINAIRESYEKPGPLSENIKSALFQTKNYPGVCGAISILPDGASEGIHPGLYQYTRGKIIRIEK